MISNKIRLDYLDEFKKSAFRIFDRDEETQHEPKVNLPTEIKEKEQMTQRRQQ